MKFSIYQHFLCKDIESELLENHKDRLNWPLVYFLENSLSKPGEKGDAYVGETTDVVNRLKTHAKTEKKQTLNSVRLIVSEIFNKSATLDLESNLIRYISADGKYTLQNGNLGITNHQYYQQELYWNLFKDVWNELRSLGIARHSLNHIDNSDLFKYSPYKSLSVEQIKSLKTILNCLLDPNAKMSLIEGGAGTGKSILAIFLFKLLKTDLSDFNYSDFDEQDLELFELLKGVKKKYEELRVALVIPMASFRQTISKVFKNIKGLSNKMVIGPSDLVKDKYDLLIVDEGHRLRRRVNLGSYYGTFDANCIKLGLDKITASELDWIQLQSEKSIIFYDRFQSIKPSDVEFKSFEKLRLLPDTRVEILNYQLRVKGGNKYVKLVHKMFSSEISDRNPPNLGQYDFKIFDDLNDMVSTIKNRDQTFGLSRMVAGFAWDWVSKNNKDLYDINIGETKLRWNSVDKDWVNSLNAINEVGCIHTTQGYDLNYTGIIIGPELDYDFDTRSFIVYKDRYKDKNGKNSIKDNEVLKEYVINIYKTIMLRGILGTYLYVCNPNLRKYLSQFINKEISLKAISNLEFLDFPSETTIPYYDLSIAAGSFSEKQTLDNIRYINMPQLSNQSIYFACKVVGESMNKIIPNGSICLFKKYEGGSRNGLITLVEGLDIFDNELGANYTIKEYSSKKEIKEDGWTHFEIELKPCSTEYFETILLRDESTISFKIIGIFERVLTL